LGEITPIHVRIVTDAAQRLSTWDIFEQVTHDATNTANGTEKESAQAQLAIVLAQVAFEADCVALQHRVLPVARRQGYTRTKAASNRAIEKIDAAGQARRRAAARRYRDVYLTPEVDGLTTLIARLDTFTANAIMGAINAGITNPTITGSCDATVGERRSEAFRALIFGVFAKGASSADTGCTGSCATPIAVSVTLDLTVPVTELDIHLHSQNVTGISTATGISTVTCSRTTMDSSPSADSIGCDFRHLLADPAMKVFARPVAVNESGHVLDVGRRRYQITGALRRMIIARDGTCRFPGCNAAAIRCQIDHVIPWDEGGASDVKNLGALCIRHHQLKTHGGWEITNSTPEGSCTWRSPQGFMYYHYATPITDPQSAAKKKSNSVLKQKPYEAMDPPDLPTF
jgi:hypothetical protein